MEIFYNKPFYKANDLTKKEGVFLKYFLTKVKCIGVVL